MRKILVGLALGVGASVAGSLFGVPPYRIFFWIGGGFTLFALYRDYTDLAQVAALLTIAGVIAFK